MADEYATIVELPVEAVVPYAKNPRQNAAAVEGVAKSIEKFGFLVPLVVDTQNVIITGHTRWQAARKLGLETIPVIRADHLTEEEAKAFRLADNRLAENATWEQTLLAEELQALRDMGFDLDDTGFSVAELDCLLEPIKADCLDDLSAEAVCGDVAQYHLQTKTSTKLILGLYRLTVKNDTYTAWETDLILQFKTKNAIEDELARRLGFKPGDRV